MTERPEAEQAKEAFLRAAMFNALAEPVFSLDRADRFVHANSAAEQFWQAGEAFLRDRTLGDMLTADHPLFGMLSQVRATGVSLADHGLMLESPRIGSHEMAVHLAPVQEVEGLVVVSLHRRTVQQAIERRLTHRGAARSVSAMAALLAHEVKNPLSGIRGAAQLLELSANESDRRLTRLICEETDRICGLVDRMESFADGRALPRTEVNIHRILDHVRNVAAAGFARHVGFQLAFDPSLPPALGNHDALVQAFLNLVKNAVEAAPKHNARITLGTAFRHGLRLAAAAGGERMELPLMVSVSDNGGGIPEDLRPHLFEPFVSSKARGTGLGLALVAKVVQDHGGVIEFDTSSQGTEFRMFLPIADTTVFGSGPH
ncbi:MAG: nitrogen regulation protein NR(II) [Alphaproteobacteria bacterium]